MSNLGMQLELTMTAKGVQAALKDAQGAIVQTATVVKTQLGSSSPANQGLSQFKEAMGRSRETAMFFTAALGEFGPAGKTAQIAMSGVAGAFLGGGGVLAVLSLAQAGVRLLVDAWKEEEEAAKKAAEEEKKAAEERAKRLQDATKFGNDRIASLKAMVASFKETTAAERAQAEVSAINAQLQATAAGAHRQTLARRLLEAQALAKQVADLEAVKKGEEAEMASFKTWADLREAGLKRLEEAEKLQAIRMAEVMAGKADAFRQYQTMLEDTARRATERFNQPIQANLPTYTPAEIAAAERFLRIQNQIVNVKEKLAEGALQMGAAWGFAFAEMMTGAKSFGQVMGNVLKQTLNMIIEAVKTEIMADAAASAAKAYNSQAGIPVIGPVLGAAAMVAALSLVQGLIGQVPSAAGGWERVPNDTMAMIHKDEQVLPAQYAEGLRNLVAGGGGSGVNITMNVSAQDAKSFRRFALDNSGAFLEAVTRAVRDGRRG